MYRARGATASLARKFDMELYELKDMVATFTDADDDGEGSLDLVGFEA